MNQKASIVADAASHARTRLGAEHGRRGDMQTLARLVNVPMAALAQMHDEIAGKTTRLLVGDETQDGQLQELNTELLKANLLNSVLVEALRPFADVFEETQNPDNPDDCAPDDMPIGEALDLFSHPTVSDLRGAREALSQAERGRGADRADEGSTPVSLRATPNGEPA